MNRFRFQNIWLLSYGQPMHRLLVRPTDDPRACGVCHERVVQDFDEEEKSVC